MILNGDCLIELRAIAGASVDLVYLDPPFFTQKLQKLSSRDNSKHYSFEDSWENIESYSAYIRQRLVECRRVLKYTGSIFLHCDRTASHHLRIVLDEVFGVANFQSEIVWAYKRWSNAKRGLLNAHQIILFYSNSKSYKFKDTFTSYSPTTNIDQIFQKRARNKNGKTIYKRMENGDAEIVQEKTGVPLSDVWEIPYLNPKAKERVGYPTQKPIILLEQIIKLVTDEGDLVLDPFCGSGTTLVAAKLLDRNYIGIDISPEAVELTKTRLQNPIRTDSRLLRDGKDTYLNQDIGVLETLMQIDAEPVQRNKGIDGFLKLNGLMKPIPIRIQRKSESLELTRRLLLSAMESTGFKQAVLLKTNDIMDSTLFGTAEIESNGVYVAEDLEMVEDIKRRLELVA